MHPRGLETFERRDPARSGIYSFESRPKTLAPALERRFRANKKAWSAKQDQTRERRLAQLIEASAKGQRRI